MVAVAVMLKFCFELFFIMNQKAKSLETSLEVSMLLVDQKWLKSFWLEI